MEFPLHPKEDVEKDLIRRRDAAIEWVRKLLHQAIEGQKNGRGNSAAIYALDGKSTLMGISIPVEVARDLVSEWED